MAITWREQMRAARREFLGIVSQADREIVGIYRRAAEEMARQARNARAGSLTERWLTDYRQSLEETVGQLRRDIYGIVTDGMDKSARIPVRETGDWMEHTLQAAGVGVDGSFRSVLSRAPTEAIRSILEGRMYRDGVTLSRRIWNETGRLQWGIEDVITQGLAQQQGLKEISRALEQYLEPGEAAPIDIRRLYPNMGEPAKGGRPIPATYQIEYNSMRLARTAINHAHWGGNRAAAKLNPLCAGMQWILSDSHFERQIRKFGPDVCDDYAKHDEGLGIGVYPIERLPMPHPQCLCRQEQALPSIDEAVARLKRWLDGGSDPALEQGFQRAQRLGRMESPTTNAFRVSDGLPIIQNSPEALGRDVLNAISETSGKMFADYPVLEKLIDNLYVQPEGGVAAFGSWRDSITGVFRSGVALDPEKWRSMSSIRSFMEASVRAGEAKGVTDPMAILAHEYGHGLHTAVALKDAGYILGSPMSDGQLRAYETARRAIAQDVFTGIDAFAGAEYNTADAIYRSIREEMGDRATHSGGEFIAQSVAMVYNGTAGPIARQVVEFLRRRLM